MGPRPGRLATLAGVTGPVFGMTLDAPAAAPGALPQGGETVVDFPNNHFGYALTWFGFAILTPCAAGLLDLAAAPAAAGLISLPRRAHFTKFRQL